MSPPWRLNLAPPANAQPYLSSGWPLSTQVGVVATPATTTGKLCRVIREGVVWEDCTVGGEEDRGGVNGAFAATYRVFHRQRAGEAVAELGCIAPDVLARRTGVTRHPHVVVAVSAAVGEEVEERLRPATVKPANCMNARSQNADGVEPAPVPPGVSFDTPKRM